MDHPAIRPEMATRGAAMAQIVLDPESGLTIGSGPVR
jgi:hypothetical protein